eukprot:TRINITY_DN291_c2_g1_i1.p1 TRINITY_DN291_c2_g1~~TRINITY_DN291_c2_g1_i1.p1  ORF type:complete len:507 (+),score=79.26 TRINITY_DN291_c2_g1_i1:95-1615(+)
MPISDGVARSPRTPASQPATTPTEPAAAGPHGALPPAGGADTGGVVIQGLVDGMWHPGAHTGGPAGALPLTALPFPGGHALHGGARGPCRNEHRPRGPFLETFERDLRAALEQGVRQTPVRELLSHTAGPNTQRIVHRLTKNPYRNPYPYCLPRHRGLKRPRQEAEDVEMTEDMAGGLSGGDESEDTSEATGGVEHGPATSQAAPRPLPRAGRQAEKRPRGSDPGSRSESAGPRSKRRCPLQLSALTTVLASVDGVAGESDQSFDEGRARELFLHYQRLEDRPICPPPEEAPGEQWLSGRGLDALERDLGWPGSSSSAFALLFSLGTEYLHLISLTEWLRAFRYLGVSTIEAVRRRAFLLHKELRRNRALQTQYAMYAFKYVNKQRLRSLETPTVISLLGCVVGSASPFTRSFCQYLSQTGVRSVNFDQWRNFVPFSLEIQPDLSNYSAEDAWPTLYDNYVDWLVAQRPAPREPARDACGAPPAQRRRLGMNRSDSPGTHHMDCAH